MKEWEYVISGVGNAREEGGDGAAGGGGSKRWEQ